ncbi:MAG TPA: glycosyltransferase family 39 protein, partial [Thermoanaerobaculaceae bacterium]|nr:glycosyltransferase family 39 protein [Thermoanaerobaculaceae bacterium]
MSTADQHENAAPGELDVRGPSSKRVTRWALAALALYGAFLWLFRPASPFEWDEVLAQRAVLHYDVAAHAPQPPGFPAYIGAAKAVNWLVRDPLVALQVVGILAALLALAAVWQLSRRLGAPPLVAGAAAAVVAATPSFAFMANVGSSDVTGTAMGVAAVLALMAAVERPELLPLAAVTAGLAVGVRPQIGAVFAPALMWAVTSAVRARRWGRLALAAGLGLLVAAACWVPAILVTGPQRWWWSTTNQIRFVATVERGNHLPGARLSDLLHHWFLSSFVGWQFAVPLWLLVVVGAVVLVRTGRGRLAGTAGMAAGAYIASALLTMNMTTSLRYLLPATPFLAILAAGGLGASWVTLRRAAGTLVVLWCLAALAWAFPAFRERLKPAPVWAALTWVREHFDPAHTRIVYHGIATPHVQYVLGKQGFRIIELGQGPTFEESERPGEQTLFVTPLPVPGADLLFEAHHTTRRVLELAWGRYGSFAVSRLRTSAEAVFSPDWQLRRDGWQLAGTGFIHLPIGSKPA